VVEQAPSQDGRNMTMMLAPSKAVLAAEKPEATSSEDGAKPAERVRREARQARERDANSRDTSNGSPAELIEQPSAASVDAA
jgi:hypothetical protein